MTIQGLCVACQYGDHEHHQDVPNPGTPGRIGSRHECPCKGDCKDTHGPLLVSLLRSLPKWPRAG